MSNLHTVERWGCFVLIVVDKCSFFSPDKLLFDVSAQSLCDIRNENQIH